MIVVYRNNAPILLIKVLRAMCCATDGDGALDPGHKGIHGTSAPTCGEVPGSNIQPADNIDIAQHRQHAPSQSHVLRPGVRNLVLVGHMECASCILVASSLVLGITIMERYLHMPMTFGQPDFSHGKGLAAQHSLRPFARVVHHGCDVSLQLSKYNQGQQNSNTRKQLNMATASSGVLESLLPPAYSVTSDDRGAYLLLTSVIAIVLSGLAVAIKLYMAALTFRRLRRDDVALLAALVCIVSYARMYTGY